MSALFNSSSANRKKISDQNIVQVKPFIESTQNVLKTMARLETNAGEPFTKEIGMPRGDLSGAIGLVGDKMLGAMNVMFTRNVILKIASEMLYETFTELNEHVSDCVGELTNMICGGVKCHFGEQGHKFNLTQPMVIRGHAHTIYHMTHFPVTVIPFALDNDFFYIEMFLADIQDLQSALDIRKRVSPVS